jgi:hypothetical protein
MFAKTLIAAAALAATVVGVSAGGADAEARELNQRQTIDAGHNAQIQRTIARMRRQGAVIEDNVSGGCGGQSVGTVTVEGRAPREVNTVVLGNVINYVGAGGC